MDLSLLSLRGFACLAIILFHLRPPTSWLIIGDINVSFLTGFSGSMGVYIFYLLSGYTIGYGFFSGRYTLTPGSLVKFYRNRFLRIAPAYYVCVLLSIVVFFPDRGISAGQILKFITFTANFDYLSLPYQALLVIISTEMQFYCIAPIFFVGLRTVLHRMNPTFVGILILLLGAAVRYAMLNAGLVPDLSLYMQNVYVTVWGMIDYFLFGMLCSYLVLKRRKTTISIAYPFIFTFWLLWVNYINFFPRIFSEYALYHLFLFPPLFSLVIGWYIVEKPTFLSLFSGIGRLSYGLYLYHFVFYDLLFLSVGNVRDTMTDYLTRLLTVFPLTVIMALASHLFIERQFLFLKYKKSTMEKI